MATWLSKVGKESAFQGEPFDAQQRRLLWLSRRGGGPWLSKSFDVLRQRGIAAGAYGLGDPLANGEGAERLIRSPSPWGAGGGCIDPVTKLMHESTRCQAQSAARS